LKQKRVARDGHRQAKDFTDTLGSERDLVHHESVEAFSLVNARQFPLNTMGQPCQTSHRASCRFQSRQSAGFGSGAFPLASRQLQLGNGDKIQTGLPHICLGVQWGHQDCSMSALLQGAGQGRHRIEMAGVSWHEHRKIPHRLTERKKELLE
jgi:hypothetical protein